MNKLIVIGLIALIGAIFVLSGCIQESALELKAKEFCSEENVAAVFVCGDSHIRVVSSLAGAGSMYYKVGQFNALETGIQCPLVAPDSMSSECKELFESTCIEKQVC